MASDSEWFQGRGVDEHEVAYWGRILTELACAVCAGLILAGLSGCAEGRWLTKEEDAAMRAHCEPVGGCAVIPNPQWERIRRALGLVDA